MNHDCIRAKTAYWRQHLYLLTTAALAPALAGIYYLSFWLRFEGQLGQRALACFLATVGWVVLAKLAWFVGLHTCRGWSRSVTFYDLVALLRAATCGLLTVAMIQYILWPPCPSSLAACSCWIGGQPSSCWAERVRWSEECARRGGRCFPRPARCGC